jgi:dipeptidase E
MYEGLQITESTERRKGAGVIRSRRDWSGIEQGASSDALRSACTGGDEGGANLGPAYKHSGGVRGEHRLMKTTPQIVAFGGGGFSMESGNPLLDDYVLDLAGARSPRPRVCFLPTASGDADHYVVRFYRAFPAARCEPSHISLFRREQGPADLREHLLSQDLIYVGGGSVVSMLGAWRAHGLDEVLRAAWARGVVLCGLSAGSLCWFADAVSGFHGAARRVEGLGLLPFSNCVHYEEGSTRRRAYRDLLAAGVRSGYAAEDGAALHFVGTELSRVVASRPQARGYRLDVVGDRVVEMRIATTYLGDPGAVGFLPPLPEAMATAVAA